VTATDAILAPPEHRVRLGLSVELGIGLGERPPAPLSLPHVHVKQLAEIVAESCQETHILPARPVPCALETVHAAIRSSLHDECPLKFVEHLESDFEGVPQQAVGFAMVVVSAGRQVTDEVAQPGNDAGAQFASLVSG
jgi:hypothetical protein